MRYGALSLILACATASAFAQDAQDDVRPGEVSQTQPSVDFQIDLSDGGLVTLTTVSDTNFDTVLRVSGANGQILAENDDYAGGGLQSQIIFQPLRHRASTACSSEWWRFCTSNWQLTDGVDCPTDARHFDAVAGRRPDLSGVGLDLTKITVIRITSTSP